MAEREATKLLNGTTVTASTFHVDILRGKVWISNLIIHAPKQETWHWEAPVFARIGKVYVEANLISCLFSRLFLFEELPLDFYTVLVSDIQVFIERKHNVYNFLLLDPHVVVPLPPQPTAPTQQTERDVVHDVFVNPNFTGDESSTTNFPKKEEQSTFSATDCTDSATDNTTNDNNIFPCLDEEEKAQHVVDHIVHTVRRVAVSGSDKNPVISLLDQYRHMLTNELKAFTIEKGKATKASTTAIMQEGVNLIKHVTANIAEKTVNAQQVITPARRSLPHERPVYGRVGRLLIQDMRIFVRETNRFHSNGLAVASRTIDHFNVPDQTDKSISDSSPISWHPPIVIENVAIRANEFCPPLTAKEKMPSKEAYDKNEDNYDASLMPAVYQTMDAYVEIVWKRVLAEVAKSNTGQLFQTAIGEAVNLFADSTEGLLVQENVS
jgi:hypothetical protein